MPLPAYMEIDGIQGSCEVQGRTGNVEVVGFNHEVYMPTDRKDGSATGTRVHKDLVVIKNYDKASPTLYQYLCNGKVIPSARLKWYKIDDQGIEKEYFNHVLADARSPPSGRTCRTWTIRPTSSTSTWKRSPSATRRSPGSSSKATSSSRTPGKRAGSPSPAGL